MYAIKNKGACVNFGLMVFGAAVRGGGMPRSGSG